MGARLNRTVRYHSLLDCVQTLIVTIQALIVDRSDGALGVAANILGCLYAAVVESLLDLGDELLRVDVREGEEKHTLDGDGQTENQADEHGQHPAPASLEELLHQNLVHALSGQIGLCVYGSLLCQRAYGAERSNGNRQNHKEFFHSCF